MSRAGRGSSRQNVASRKDLVVRKEREEEQESKAKRMRANETKEDGPRECTAKIVRLYRREKPGKGAHEMEMFRERNGVKKAEKSQRDKTTTII